MALEISKTAEAALTIQGTSIALDSIYARIELASGQNGVNMQMGMYYYEDQAAFDAGSSVVRIVEMASLFNGEADIAAGETQTLQLASEKVKADIEAQGYTVAIVDL
jgi:hypothetical protein